MSYRADKQVIDTHTHTDRYTDRGDDNTRRPKLATGKNCKTKTSVPLTWLFGWRPFSNLPKATLKDAVKFEPRDFLIFHTYQFGVQMSSTLFRCEALFSFDIILDNIFSVYWFWADNMIKI